MTSQPDQPATDRPAIDEDEAGWRVADSDGPPPADNQDLVVMPEGAEDDLTAEDRLTGAGQASDVSDDYPPSGEPSVVGPGGRP